MERACIMKKIVLLFLAFLPMAVMANDFAPDDGPTIEALIELHKMMKKAEDKARDKVGEADGIQLETTSQANKFNQMRTTLDSKLKGAYQYVVLASAISTTTLGLNGLIKDYAKFTSEAVGHAFKKPMCAWYYAQANYELANDYKDIKRLIKTLTASQFDIIRSTVAEKEEVVWQIETIIDRMRSTINTAYFYCTYAAMSGFKQWYIWDILNSEVTDAAAKEVINLWVANKDRI